MAQVDRRVVLLVVTLTSFLTPFSSSSFNIALPSISKEFSLDAITMSWASLSYLLTSAMFLVPFGRLADIIGRKKVYVAGTFIFSIASFLLGIYPSAEVIVILRAIQGFGTAMIFGTGIAILVSVTPANEKGTILGINAASVYVGLSAGPFLGGMITQNLGWRSLLFTAGIIGLISLVVTVLKLEGEWTEARGEDFDVRGSIVYAGTLLALMYGFSILPAIIAIIPIIVGLAGTALFIWIENHTKQPILPIKLFSGNSAFAFNNLAALINFSSTYSVTFMLSIYLQYIRGFSPQNAGLIMIASPVVQAVLSPITGKLSDKIDPQKVASIGMAITGIGLASFAFLDETTPIWSVIASLVLLGSGLALFSSPNTNAVMSSVDRRLYGVASSTLGTMRLVGQMTSMGITMIILAVLIGRVEITSAVYHELLGGAKIVFTVSAMLCVLGVWASLQKKKSK
jgi:EmrB/QacA subfamily drug resistance transporter